MKEILAVNLFSGIFTVATNVSCRFREKVKCRCETLRGSIYEKVKNWKDEGLHREWIKKQCFATRAIAAIAWVCVCPIGELAVASDAISNLQSSDDIWNHRIDEPEAVRGMQSRATADVAMATALLIFSLCRFWFFGSFTHLFVYTVNFLHPQFTFPLKSNF